jgi:drug/metabolite transporter (DMT)-like permease
VLALVASVALLPFVALEPPDHVPALETWAAMLVLGVAGTGLGFLMYYALMQDVGPGRASFVAYLIPAFAIGYGALLADEPLGPFAILGLGLILTGSYLATHRAPTAVPRPEPASRTLRATPETPAED